MCIQGQTFKVKFFMIVKTKFLRKMEVDYVEWNQCVLYKNYLIDVNTEKGRIRLGICKVYIVWILLKMLLW